MLDSNVCQTFCSHPRQIENTRAQMPSEQAFQEVANTFKLLSDFNRIRILQALSIEELCVCDLSELLNLSQSAISHQLRLLRTAKLVKFRKAGKNVFYAIDDQHVQEFLKIALTHVQGNCVNQEKDKEKKNE